MADQRTAPTVGARIAAARKARGFKSTKDLADAIPGDSITGSILQNIEAGRKNDLAVAQLLNIAWALAVSPHLDPRPHRIPSGTHRPVQHPPRDPRPHRRLIRRLALR